MTQFLKYFLLFNYSECVYIALSNTWYIFWVFVSCLIYTAWKAHALYNVINFSVSGCTMFLHIIWRMQQFSEKKSLNKKWVFSFCLQFVSANPVVQRIINRYFIMNLNMYLFKVPIILVPFQQRMNLSHNFLQDLEYKIFWIYFYSETSFLMGVGEGTDGFTESH